MVKVLGLRNQVSGVRIPPSAPFLNLAVRSRIDGNGERGDVDRFEALLRERGIEIAGQAATGSGNMLRFRLRALDGTELEVAFSAESLLERPEEALASIETMIEQRRRGHNGDNAP